MSSVLGAWGAGGQLVLGVALAPTELSQAGHLAWTAVTSAPRFKYLLQDQSS